MAKIFLSYAREDVRVAKALAAALERAGHCVWWDRHIRGATRFAEEIEAALASAEAVIVLWSQSSIASPWVRDEASAARDSGRLVPASLGGALPPMGFRQYQSVDLTGWKGRRNSAPFAALAEALDGVLRGEGTLDAPKAAPRDVAAGPTRRRRLLWVTACVALLAIGLATALYLFRGTQAEPMPIAVAVLPFDALPADETNTPFAEGVSEEISNELARNPRLRLMGRASAAMFENEDVDPRTAGRRLGVAYLLDGTVRRSGDQVRVAVELVRSSDGVQLWRHTFSGSLADVFGIQEQIGKQVEGRLRVTFAGERNVTARTLATRGDVYAYYLTARSLIRDREPQKVDAAIELLRKALALDPNYAPALATLARALQYQRVYAAQSPSGSGDPGAPGEGIGYARQALSLAPRLAQAHAAYAIALSGLDDPPRESMLRHLRIAAQLDPNDAESWNSLAQEYEGRGDFPRALDAWRKAVAIDPLWWRAYWGAAGLAWTLGYRDEAAGYVTRFARDADPQPFSSSMARADLAGWQNDLSERLRLALAAHRDADPGRQRFAEMSMSFSLHAAGYLDEARTIWHFYPVDEPSWRMWHGKAPSPQEVRERGWRAGPSPSFLLATLLNERRAPEAVRLFDERFQSPEAFANSHRAAHLAFVDQGSLLVLALREAGRAAEADRMLRLVDSAMTDRLRAGRVPADYLFLRARALALRGRTGDAVGMLEQAERRGWRYANSGAFQDLMQDPLLRPLHGDARFQALVARERAWKSRERREMAPMLRQLGA